MQEHIVALTKPDSIKAYIALSEIVGDLFPSIKMLCCYLRAALITYENYQKLDIDDEIYIETMKFFTRFIGECVELRGALGFDRAAWSRRHLNMSIIRIGALEYELKTAEDNKVVSIHVPSGASLSFIFQKADCSDYNALPEKSSLQRKLKEFLLSGGVITSGYGVVKEGLDRE